MAMDDMFRDLGPAGTPDAFNLLESLDPELSFPHSYTQTQRQELWSKVCAALPEVALPELLPTDPAPTVKVETVKAETVQAAVGKLDRDNTATGQHEAQVIPLAAGGAKRSRRLRRWAVSLSAAAAVAAVGVSATVWQGWLGRERSNDQSDILVVSPTGEHSKETSLQLGDLADPTAQERLNQVGDVKFVAGGAFSGQPTTAAGFELKTNKSVSSKDVSQVARSLGMGGQVKKTAGGYQVKGAKGESLVVTVGKLTSLTYSNPAAMRMECVPSGVVLEPNGQGGTANQVDLPPLNPLQPAPGNSNAPAPGTITQPARPSEKPTVPDGPTLQPSVPATPTETLPPPVMPGEYTPEADLSPAPGLDPAPNEGTPNPTPTGGMRPQRIDTAQTTNQPLRRVWLRWNHLETTPGPAGPQNGAGADNTGTANGGSNLPTTDPGQLAATTDPGACVMRVSGQAPSAQKALQEVQKVAASLNAKLVSPRASVQSADGLTQVSVPVQMPGQKDTTLWRATVSERGVATINANLGAMTKLGDYKVISQSEALRRLNDPKFGPLDVYDPAGGPAGGNDTKINGQISLRKATLSTAPVKQKDGSLLSLPVYLFQDIQGRVWTVLAVADN